MDPLPTPKPDDLASLLWEKQGRPEGHTDANWLEAEERRLEALRRTSDEESEIDLRSRGLGPITNQSRKAFVSEGGLSKRVNQLILMALGVMCVFWVWRKVCK
jgi:hypothetical protein